MTEPRLKLKTVAVRDDGCYSVLLWDGRPFAVSVEHTFGDGRPVLWNGMFECVRSQYFKGGYPTFEIMVQGHSRILFHKGNREEDSRGCVVLGEQFGVLNGQAAVQVSGAAYDEFMALTKGLDRFSMEVSGR